MTAKQDCGGCHQWGYDPIFIEGQCAICDRTPDEVKAEHGFVFLKEVEKSIKQTKDDLDA